MAHNPPIQPVKHPPTAPPRGRLFLRIPPSHHSPTGFHLPLGPFLLSLTLTEIDSSLVRTALQSLQHHQGETQPAVNGVFEYEVNGTEGQAPKLAGLDVTFNGRSVWECAPGRNFVSASDIVVCVSCHGVGEKVEREYTMQTVDSIGRGPADTVTIRGELGGEVVDGGLGENKVEYIMQFVLGEEGVLGFKVECGANRVGVVGMTGEGEGFFGFGHDVEDGMANGREVVVWNKSVGVEGRRRRRKARGSSCSVPQFVTNHGRCFFLLNSEPSVFDLRRKDCFSIRVHSSTMTGMLIAGKDMMDVIQIYTSIRGRTRPLPAWTRRGVIMGVSGGTDSVRSTVKRMAEYQCPVSGVLIHDWCGMNDEGRVWYNWIVEKERYQRWSEMVAELDVNGINLGVYVNPMLEDIPVHLRSGRRVLFQEAEREGYLIQTDSGSRGKKKKSKAATTPEVYNMNKKNSRVGLLDLTNFEACQWWNNVLRTEVMGHAGASFWMADLGENAPVMGMHYHQRHIHPLAFHNAYSEEWARVNREAIRDAGREGDGFFIVKSGYGQTPKYVGCTCIDLLLEDGLCAMRNGIVNGGFSGFTYGHVAVNFGPRSIGRRTREMTCRWMEMMAFTAVFRTVGEEYGDVILLKALARWSVVYASLAEYRTRLMSEASFRGVPVVRHPILHFPLDGEFMKRDGTAFMLGDSMYVAPVMNHGVNRVKVYLPEGEWIHLWTDDVFGPGEFDNGTTVEVNAPVGKPPVFYRKCEEMTHLVSRLKREGIVIPEESVPKPRWRSFFGNSL